MLQDFKKFLMRGNLIDLATAVVIGIAFGAVVDSLVTDVFTPLLAAIAQQPDLSGLTVDVGEGVVAYGLFLNALINFLIVGAVIFFILKGVERLERRRASGASDVPEPAPSNEELLLTEIRDLLAQSR